MNKKYKLDLFELLKNIDTQNVKYYKNLSEEEKKEISPYLIMKWLASTKSMQQVYYVNEILNPFVFPLSKHKDLLIYLAMICTDGTPKRYKFKKCKNAKKENYPKSLNVIKEFFSYSTKYAKEVFPIFSKEDIISMAENLGFQDNEIKEIKKELKNYKK